MEAIKGIFHGATPEELRERFAKHVAQAKDTLRVLTTPEGGGAEGDAPAGYADATTPMNVVELFNCQALVFVSAWKAGAVVSAMHGHGFVIKRVRGEGRGYGGPTMARWSAPLPIELTSGAIGLTLGVGSMDSVLVLDTEKAVDAFKHTQVSLGNDFTGEPSGPRARASSLKPFRAVLTLLPSHRPRSALHAPRSARRQGKARAPRRRRRGAHRPRQVPRHGNHLG